MGRVGDLDDMAAIRMNGCAINYGEWRTEVRGVAAPVFDGSGRAVAALGVCSPASRMPDSRLHEACALVTSIAARLSANLGGGRPPANGDTFRVQERKG